MPRAAAGSRHILSESTFWPLGRAVGVMDGVDNFLLAHPAVGHADGRISLFADVAEGEVITQMSGEAQALADRAGRVAAQATRAIPPSGQVLGALTVYCAGCMLAVRDRMEAVVAGLNGALEDAPYLGIFTFGEQGPVLGQGNRHGNLMISCIVFWE